MLCLIMSSVSCASFSPSSHHHQPNQRHHHSSTPAPSNHQKMVASNYQVAPSNHGYESKLLPPPAQVASSLSRESPMSAALRSTRASASLEIMPMGDIKKAVGESFVVICRGSPNNPGTSVSDLKWFNPRNEEMFPSKDISIISTNNHEKKQLAFMNPTINDAGLYTCSGKTRDADLLEAKVRVVIYGECFFLYFSYSFPPFLFFNSYPTPFQRLFLFFSYLASIFCHHRFHFEFRIRDAMLVSLEFLSSDRYISCYSYFLFIFRCYRNIFDVTLTVRRWLWVASFWSIFWYYPYLDPDIFFACRYPFEIFKFQSKDDVMLFSFSFFFFSLEFSQRLDMWYFHRVWIKW